MPSSSTAVEMWTPSARWRARFGARYGASKLPSLQLAKLEQRERLTCSRPRCANAAADADMLMLTFPDGMERRVEEYRGLFERSGFRLGRVTATNSAVTVIEGTPA